MREDIEEILIDEYGEVAPCILNLIMQRMREKVEGAENPYRKIADTYQKLIHTFSPFDKPAGRRHLRVLRDKEIAFEDCRQAVLEILK